MKILVIEDEHKIAGSIKKGLEQENFVVDVSYEGENGFDLASSEEYDLIILDRLLPQMDGVEICKKLRKEKIHTPILMLTSKRQVEDRVEGLNAGADDYLVKPFAFEELLARVKAVVSRPKDKQNPILTFEDLTMNTLTYQVKRNDKQIRLSQKEYALLEYLLRHPNQIVTKNQIIRRVWNYDADISNNAIEVYIGYLRSKIDKPFKNKPSLIQTARGFGYKIGKGT